jgi:hypothetical protein
MANAYTNQIHDGTLPAPVGNVATALNADSLADQRTAATSLFTFLQNPERELLQLNIGDGDKPRTFLINLPNSSKVRVCHCIGVGASAIGTTSPTDGKLLVLTGDGGHDIGAPAPLVLPKSMVDAQDIISMTHELFVSRLAEKGRDYTWPLASRAKACEGATNTFNIMAIAPIPIFLVNDGIEADLDAALVYERVLGLDDATNDMFTHLKHFLLAVLTGHNQNDIPPHVTQDDLFAPTPADAKKWAKTKFNKCYPTLAPPNVPVQPNAEGGNAQVAQILAQLLQLQQQTNQRNNEEEKKDDEVGPNPNGFSIKEWETICEMCGKQNNANITTLPQWIQDISDKSNSESYKMTIIRKHIMDNEFYDDAEVPLTATLLKMVAKRNWAGKDGNIKRPSILHAAEGLSPFMVLDFSEDEVAALNDADENIGQASHVTPGDIKALKSKFKPKVPDTSEKFIVLLKTFANLIFSLFSIDSPLFQYLQTVIKALREYSPRARDAMSNSTKASILWVILKQSRLFAIGETAVLAEFQEVQRILTAKSASYNHAETPQELIETSNASDKKRKKEDKSKNSNQNEGQNKQLKPTKNANCWHPKLKAALEGPLQVSNHPSFLAIFQYCGTNPDEVCARWESRCAPNLFFGKCFYGDKCRKEHVLAKEWEIPKMLKLVEKFVQKPLGLRQGQSPSPIPSR